MRKFISAWPNVTVASVLAIWNAVPVVSALWLPETVAAATALTF
jgi:uncharacterized protein involved in cysteine biosynthesis